MQGKIYFFKGNIIGLLKRKFCRTSGVAGAVGGGGQKGWEMEGGSWLGGRGRGDGLVILLSCAPLDHHLGLQVQVG